MFPYLKRRMCIFLSILEDSSIKAISLFILEKEKSRKVVLAQLESAGADCVAPLIGVQPDWSEVDKFT